MNISQVMKEVNELNELCNFLLTPNTISINEANQILEKAGNLGQSIINFLKTDQKLVQSLYYVEKLKQEFTEEQLSSMYSIYPSYTECCQLRENGVYNKELETKVLDAGFFISEEGRKELYDIYISLYYDLVNKECIEVINRSTTILKQLRESVRKAQEKRTSVNSQPEYPQRTFVKSPIQDLAAFMLIN